FQDGDGAPVYEGWIRDQERERELEELLQRQESLFMSLFTAVAEAMIVLDDRGIVVSCNQAAERLLGEKLDRLLGRHITACFESYAAASGEELPASSLPAVQTLASGESSENDLVGLQLKSGDRIWARMRSAAVRLPGGASSSVIVSLVDQTQLQLLEEKLVDAQKLEVSSLAAHGMTHDLRNAVTSIGAMAELIEERDDDLAEAKRHAEQIRQAAGHAHSIVSQILGFTRNRTTQLAPVEVDGVMVGLRDLLRGMIPREISLEVDLRARGHRVLSTVGYVEQIILNLLINGRDAMLDGGKLTIESELVALLEPKTLGGRELSAGSYVLLTVTDEGVGMEAPVRQRAFEPFFTTKGQQEGTGLGLWSVRNLAQRGGGEAVIESSLGRGTIVRVYLPLVS
ncbi:MAG: ATP-binding protein, partial [Acidobacteriota bacterium]